MLRKVLGLILLFFALAVVAWILFKTFKERPPEGWQAIPGNASMIIEITEPFETLEKLDSENELWESLVSNNAFDHYRHEFAYVDSVLKLAKVAQSDEQDSRILISFHTGKEDNTRLFALFLPATESFFDRLVTSVEDRFGLLPLAGGKNAYKLFGESSDRELFLAYSRGMIFCSGDKSLIDEAIANTSSQPEQHFSNQPGFRQLLETTGRNVDAHVYLNYRRLDDLLNLYRNKDEDLSGRQLGNFADWSAVDVMIKEKEILMSGFTTLDSTGTQLLDQLKQSDPVDHQSINIIPFNTNLLLSYAIPQGYMPSADTARFINTFKTSQSAFFEQLEGEIAFVSNDIYGGRDNCWFIARVKSPLRMDEMLKKMTSRTSGQTIASSDKVFREIRYKGLVADLFGQVYAGLEDTWYCFVEDFVVFGNSPQSLTNFLRFYDTGKTLDLNEGFKAISDNISGNSNLLALIRPVDLLKNPSRYLNEQATENLQKYPAVTGMLQGLALQFTRSDPFVFTSLYLLHNKDMREENLAVWKTELDSRVSGKPYLVRDHTTGMFNVVAFDSDANIYLISTDGKILWKKRIDALPESPIFQVDYYRNGKVQYLFNTRDFIYLIDKNGDNVASYPKKLNPSATNGLSLFDYENSKNYRLLIAQSDKRVYNYTLKGRQVQGWSKPKTVNIVSDPITRLVAGNKDYILINDLDNNISIVNRRGNTRIQLKENPMKARNSAFYLNRTNSKGIIITTNESGTLTYINGNGSLEYTDFGDFSSIHFFLYNDFNGDGAEDFIFLDGNELTVFDRFKNVLFNYRFASTISIKPEFFSLGRNQKVLGIVADQEKAIYLFDKNGNTIISRGLIGETPFTVGSLEDGNEINLITAADNVLYNYRLK